MTEKRALAQDEPASEKTSRHNTHKKRRKLLHDADGATSSPAPHKQSPAKQSSSQHRKSKEKSKEQGLEQPPSNRNKKGVVEAAEQSALLSVSRTLQHAEDEAPDGQLSQHVRPKPSPNWSVSRCAGGRFLNLDPVFAGDGRYLVLATEYEAQIFAMSTSRIVRTLPTDDSERLTGYKLSPGYAEHLFVSSTSGSIVQWNWASGAKIQSTKKQYPVVAIDVASSADDLLVFALCEADDGTRQIFIDVPSEDEASGEWKSAVILTTNSRVSNMAVAAGGQLVFAWTGDRLFVGHMASPPVTSTLESTKYTWREAQLPVRATCLDVRVPEASDQPPRGGASAAKPELPRADVAVGEPGGSILIYNDILGRLMESEKGDTDRNLVSSRLHWHRKAVKAVRWSRDGNYIISGGLETVLVLWQLDTGRKQFLPHLSAPICNVVVSPTGASYAIRLGDNSAMVLSTSELRPVASMSGLQLPHREDILARPIERKGKGKGNKAKSSAGRDMQEVSSRLPAVLHPIKPDHLLLAVPSTQLLPSIEANPTAALLQAFDIRSGQHVSRQALTRTNVSVLGSGPQGTDLTTPDIRLVSISSDGDWLATVDEWDQYPEDNNILRPDAETRSRGINRELFLKFWQWDESRNEWQLVTRVDAPHFNTLGSSSAVLDLAVQPEGLGFATVGCDGVVRLWSPGTERGGGRNKNEGKRRAVRRSWQCSRAIVLEKEPQVSKSLGASLSFSGDGSILAVSWPGTSQGSRNLVHLIDPATGAVRRSRDDLFVGTPRGMGFLDRYLIVLSDHLVIWDIVSDEIETMLQFSGKRANSFLAVNPRSKTFAVTHSGYELAVFEPSSPQPVFQTSLKNPVRALIPDFRSGEYVAIDTAAQVMRAGSGQRSPPLTLERGEAEDMAVYSNNLENIFGGFAAPSAPQTAAPTGGAIEDEAAPDAGPGTKRLTDIFDVAPSFAMPAVDVLFKNVVDLFSASAAEA